MSKELEALDWLLENEMIYRGRTRLPISPALREIKQRLESIDNSNPSEALEGVDILYANAVDLSKENECIKYLPEYLKPIKDNIKQALLKTQEPKQYLKWEDLEFKEEEQTMKVILNEKEYILKYEKLKDYDVDRVRIIDKCCYKYMMLHTSTKQFFNDLRLEKVE